jgi:DNA-binding SARP family transcriptional activator/tetratricopeptide (TPR) repeat protein
VLGPVEVAGPGAQGPTLRPQHRAFLAYLLLHNGQTISVDQFVEAMWAGRPPASARTQIHGCASRLRQVLLAVGPPGALTGRSGGYRLTVDPDDLDLASFRAGVARAHAAARVDRPDEAARLFRAALGLWRGRALTGAVGAFVPAAASALEEQRLAVVEDLNRAELALGRHGLVAERCRVLVAEHPLRERLAAHLMLALAGSGRQAEALEVYRRIRDRLVRQLGVEPGAELAEAQLRVLRQTVGPRPATGGDAADGPAPARPAQLPADIVAFAGRAAQLRRLDELLEGHGDPPTVIISAIDGMAGVGKTALAIHWAHRIRDRFDGGQLYVNLRGFDPVHPPVSPAVAVRAFLEALAVPPAKLPSGVDAQAALFRTLAAQRRLLVLLDNARDAEQVRPLLPGAPGSLVIVTSRTNLAGLIVSDAAHSMPLDVMSPVDATALLARRIGAGRVGAEPQAVARIMEACAGLPLALAIVAAQVVSRPSLSLADLAEELRRGGDLDRLATGDPATDVRAVFSWSYGSLGPDAATLFRRLSLHPGPDVGAPAAASLVGRPGPEVASTLGDLARARLVTERAPDRYGYHDLLRVYARELARSHDDEADRRAAIRRLLDHYLHTAHSASALIDPHRDPIPLAPAADGVGPERFADAQEAMAWMLAEHAVLIGAVDLAARAGFDRRCWELAWCLVVYFDLRGHPDELIATQTIALAAAVRLDDAFAQTRTHLFLGRTTMGLHRFDEAHAHLREALRCAEPEGPAAQAHIHHNLSDLLARRGDQARALSHAREALLLYKATGSTAGTARMLNTVGWYLAQFGRHHEAMECCEESLALARRIGDRYSEAGVLDSIGYIHCALGDHGRGIVSYEAASRAYRDAADRVCEAATLDKLGEAHLTAADPVAAAAAWHRCVEILDGLGDPTADQIRAKLDELSHPSARTGSV